MPKPVLTRKRSWIARFAVLAMVFSLLAVALPASAHSVAIDTSTSCPSTTPSAGFTDIGGFDATTQLAINCLFAFGITTGTSATTYSPNDTTTRWQMALFLIRQAADHGITIPTATSQGYTDIGSLPQSTQDAINQITQLGISKGTSTTTFSPFDGVSRWQMALFIYRTGLAAGVSFASNTGHNEYTDIGSLLAEAQTAINALSDTRADPEGHIALGTGGSAFSPSLLLVRWQMALFLTRLLAADNVAAPAGTRVVVNPGPTATLALSTGQSRTYTATFTNADGSAYTQRVGIQLLDVSASNAPIYNNPADLVRIETTSDGLVLSDTNADANNDTATGVAGSDGVVTFTIRSVGAGEKVIPVAWEDLDGDLTYETSGNFAPTEPFGLGGLTDFVVAAPPEASAGSFTVTVTKTIKASDVFEGTTAGVCSGAVLTCSYFYDSGDIFTVDGLAATLADFESVLSRGDVVTTTYDPDAADQSTFALADVVAELTVTTPSAATAVDAGTFDIKGTGDPDATIRVKSDLNNDNDAADAGEGTVATGTVDADGNWTVTTPLTQNVANNFVVTQQPVGGVQMGNTQPGDLPPDVAGGADDVFTITEGPVAGTSFTSTDSTTDAGVADTLDPGDVVTIVFTGDVAGVGSGDTFSLLDTDGTTATIICGTHATCAEPAAGTVTITMTAVLPTTGGTTGGINNAATITALTGFTAADGTAISLSGDRTFTMP